MGTCYQRFSRLIGEIAHQYTSVYIQKEQTEQVLHFAMAHKTSQKVDVKVWKMVYDVNGGLFILIFLH
jgi:hypothetical protein